MTAPLPPIGGLVTYKGDARIPCAANLYCVIDRGKDKKGDLQPVLCGIEHGGQYPFLAEAGDCEMPEAFGMYLAWIDCRVQTNDSERWFVQFRPEERVHRDGTPRKWGKQTGAIWDFMGRAEIWPHRFVPLIRAWMKEASVRREAEMLSRKPYWETNAEILKAMEAAKAEAEPVSEAWPTSG